MRIAPVAVSLCLALSAAGCGDRGTRPAASGDAHGRVARVETTSGIPPQHLDSVIALFNRGVALMERSQPAEAARAFDQAVRLAPRWTTGRVNLGIALLNTQEEAQLARSGAEFRRVIAEQPGNPFAHYALGMLLKHVANFEDARREFECVLETDPGDPDAHYQVGTLVADTDPEAAIRHFEKTLERLPHHEAACYRLQSLLRAAGREDEASAVLSQFEALKASGAGVASVMRYGEMGRYAEVVRNLGPPPASAEREVIPGYTDQAAVAKLALAGAGSAGWPGEALGAGAAAFGPGVACADVDGDSDLDLYLTGTGPGHGVLCLNERGRFVPASDTGIDGRNAIGAYFGDYDGDGDPDLYLTCVGPNRLYRNDGRGRFRDVTAATGTAGGDELSVGAAWADADHDGDLDLYVANFAHAVRGIAGRPGARNALWRNNGNGTFTDVAVAAGLDCGEAPSTSVLFFDADGDRDLDLYVIQWNAPDRIFLNDRVGRYTDATRRFPELADVAPGLGVVPADLDQDGRQDLLLLRGRMPPRLMLQVERGRYVEDLAFAGAVRGMGAVGGLVGDLDLDGDPDLVLLDAAGPTGIAHRILMNRGGGRFAAPVALGPERSLPDARGAVAVDLDGDGSLELLVSRSGAPAELWRAPRPRDRRWLEVATIRGGAGTGLWPEPEAVGLAVEVKTGRGLQSAIVTSSSGYLGSPPARLHFGAGANPRADYVRLEWPDATLQSELDVATDQQMRIAKVARKASSCPVLFSWSGERFEFVTDFLGVGGLGFFVAPGVYAPPDPTEDVRIPPELVKPQAGRYALRVAEPLEEVTYLDELHLLAYDHPRRSEVYPDERFASAPPFPTGRPHAIDRKIFPVAARDDRGHDVLERLLAIDRRQVEPPVDPRFVGYARDHWIELDFGDRLRSLPVGAHPVLFLYGWVEYTYSHVNYAAYQAGITMRPPAIEVPDGRGGWRVAVPDAGFPAGLPRMMTLDLSGLLLRGDARLRLATNMEIYWDQAFIAADAAGPKLAVHVLRLVRAELRPLGYPREYSPDGANPTLYDYQRVDHGARFKSMAGPVTPWGDVRALLHSGDDRFAIMRHGDEIALEFEASRLPEVPQGWTRTLVLHAEGYCKDMDLYTAFPETVEPLPYRSMKNYPPPESAPGATANAGGRVNGRWSSPP